MTLTRWPISLASVPSIKQQRCQLPLKGKGALLWDENNKEYIDAIASWWVNPMGIRIHLSPMPFTSN
jgi:adenosylmethionine-8-amino-7-oxononanoate aminotransferase